MIKNLQPTLEELFPLGQDFGIITEITIASSQEIAIIGD